MSATTDHHQHDDEWEAERLAYLHSLGILDSDPAETSNAIVNAAARIAGVPMSAISIIDTDRQWFKATCGMGDATQTDRDVSFCAHTIHFADRMIVEDATADPRFRDNPVVTGPPHVRFYAGFVLRMEGRALGALCVVDDKPRSLSVEQALKLQDLADFLARWIARSFKPTA
jgi:GAF domain-containing protein